MSLVTKIEHDPTTESVITYPASHLENNKAFYRAYKRLHNSGPFLACHSSGPGYDTRYWSEQQIAVLDDKHIAAINSVGLDAVLTNGANIVVVPKDYVHAVKRQDHNGCCITFNPDRIILFDLMKKHNISYDEYLKMCNSAMSSYLDAINKNKIRYLTGISGHQYESDVDF